MNATERARRSDSLHYDSVSRRALCDMVARLESDNEELARLASDMLETMGNAARGFSVHPKEYRDYRSRARKLEVEVDE